MKRFLALLLLPLAVAACSKGDGGNGSTAAAAPVAAVKPPAGQDWTQVVVKTPENGFRMGNPDAPIKLVEYGSRTCPICGMFGRAAMQPLENVYVKSGKVSYEFRDFMVHGAPDLPASLIGRCIGTAPFFPFLEAMYVDQAPFEDKLTNAAATQALQAKLAGATPPQIAAAWADYMGFVDFAKQRGIPEAKVRACLSDQKAIDDLTKLMEVAQQQYNVTGTPNFFINGVKNDAISWADLEPALKKAGA